MPDPHQLTRERARQIAVRAQLLDADRPTDLAETIQRLWLVQHDPTKAIAPSADLVLWSRLGDAYDVRDLRDALDELRVIEINGVFRDADDLRLFTAEMAAWPGEDAGEWQLSLEQWVHDNNACRLDILGRLRADGPLTMKDLPDSCVRPWRSSGWNNNRNVTMLLGLLVARGEVAVAGGTGRARLWDLAERIYPGDDPVPLAEAARLRDERRLASLGVARRTPLSVPGEPVHVGDAGEAAVIEGVKGEWRVDPAYLEGPFEGRCALLSPFDRLIHDRKRMTELFEFDYQLEMFKPEAKRRWGYYALPILHGDALVGKLDAKADPKRGLLEVYAVHEDVPFTRHMMRDVDAEIAALARWLDVQEVRVSPEDA